MIWLDKEIEDWEWKNPNLDQNTIDCLLKCLDQKHNDEWKELNPFFGILNKVKRALLFAPGQ